MEDHHWEEADYLALLRKVKDSRDNFLKVNNLLSTERTLWNTEHQELIKAANEADQVMTAAEAALRSLVLEDNAHTGRTKYGIGVQIKVFETIKYDESKALFWAKENFKAAVLTVLDKKVFEAFAKNHPLPGLVEAVKTPKAMLPSKIELQEPAPAEAPKEAP
jgi:hypothetical protein